MDAAPDEMCFWIEGEDNGRSLLSLIRRGRKSKCNTEESFRIWVFRKYIYVRYQDIYVGSLPAVMECN